MHFALLVPQLPHVQESRVYYDGLLSLHDDARRGLLAATWTALKALVRRKA